jgi:hypothetical protein
MRRAGAKEKSLERESETKLSSGSPARERQEEEQSRNTLSSSPRFSRDSILRDFRTRDINIDEAHEFSSLLQSSSPHNRITLDPDIPLPSLEGQDDGDDCVSVKEEPEDDDDLYAIPDLYAHDISEDFPCQGSERSVTLDDDDDDEESRYSGESKGKEPEHISNSGDSDELQSTPVIQNILNQHAFLSKNVHDRLPLCDFSSIVGDPHFSLDLVSFADEPSSAIEPSPKAAPPLDMIAIRNSLQRPETPQPDNRDIDSANYHGSEEASTPESVIRRPVANAALVDEYPSIPEPIATIKAPGGLKTRPSLTPADTESMAAIRRKVSGQDAAVSPIPESHRSSELLDNVPNIVSEDENGGPYHEKRQSSLVKLDIPVSGSDEGLGFGLDQEFDRVIEAQKVRVNFPFQNFPSSFVFLFFLFPFLYYFILFLLVPLHSPPSFWVGLSNTQKHRNTGLLLGAKNIAQQ